jgi:carbon monoxide dehydrogenase subunit G
MPEISYTTTMKAARAEVWEFVKDMNNWAPFTRGYQTHEVINDRESLWTVKGDLGPISRVTKFHVTVTQWIEGEKVAFKVRGLNEPITGDGAIHLTDNGNPEQTEIRGVAKLAFGGSLGPVVNHLVVPFVKAAADELITKIVIAITGEAPERRPFFVVEIWRKVIAAVSALARAVRQAFGGAKAG